jgi:hypothetical protein
MRGRRPGTLRRWGHRVVLLGWVAFHPGAALAIDACADADGDGVTTVTDGVQALRAAAGLESTCTPFRCDVDGSGEVTVTDGVGVLARAADLRLYQFYDCPVPSTLHDFSDFTGFHLTRDPAFGYCPELGSVLDVELAPRSDGTYVARFSRPEVRPLDDPNCLGFYYFGDGTTCIVSVPQPERVLTADEMARVRAASAIVEVHEARIPVCAIVVFDPCVINDVAWDDFTVQDQQCGAPWIDFADVDALTAALDAILIAAPSAD